VKHIKSLIFNCDARLTIDERNLLSVAYKNITNVLRNSWRVVDTLEKLESSRSVSGTKLALARLQRQKIEKELADVCEDLVNLLEDQLIPVAETGEEIVFYLKM
jgi:14-3-3 protein epsilon